MAKDPAFLFYPGDYVSGTMHLDFECKGAYMDLLMLQFQKEHMSLHMIKQVLGHTFDHIWPLICDKFREKDGQYWNERLRIEKEKRTKFCKSRRENRNRKKDIIAHMYNHMENENIIHILKQLESICGPIEDSKKDEFMYLVVEMIAIFKESNPDYFFEEQSDYSACLGISYKIAEMKKWMKADVVDKKLKDVLKSWTAIVDFIKNDDWLKSRSLTDINTVKEWQRLVQKMNAQKIGPTKKMVI